MEKEISNYLHLYLGCDCQVALEGGEIMKGIIERVGNTSAYIRYKHPHEDDSQWTTATVIKLLLRPLSDMTDEEALQSAKLLGGVTYLSDASAIAQAKELLCTNMFHVKQTNISGFAWSKALQYLLSKGFDLFGLIDSNVAIDKTKL